MATRQAVNDAHAAVDRWLLAGHGGAVASVRTVADMCTPECPWAWRCALHGNLQYLVCHELASSPAFSTTLHPSTSIYL